jgi:predicted Fe-Mo cluster-binding NifX family protein
MKIAVVSNDGETVSRHFGKAHWFVVLTVEDGAVTAREMREKRPASQPGQGEEAHGQGARSPVLVTDCRAVVAGGMGTGAVARLRDLGLEAIATDERSVDEAALRYARGDLPHHDDLVHAGGGGRRQVRFEPS